MKMQVEENTQNFAAEKGDKAFANREKEAASRLFESAYGGKCGKPFNNSEKGSGAADGQGLKGIDKNEAGGKSAGSGWLEFTPLEGESSGGKYGDKNSEGKHFSGDKDAALQKEKAGVLEKLDGMKKDQMSDSLGGDMKKPQADGDMKKPYVDGDIKKPYFDGDVKKPSLDGGPKDPNGHSSEVEGITKVKPDKFNNSDNGPKGKPEAFDSTGIKPDFVKPQAVEK